MAQSRLRSPKTSLEVYALFDNREYDQSPYGSGYTVAGIRAVPTLVWTWRGHHSLHLGASVFKQYGTPDTRTLFAPVAYYRLQKEAWSLTTGIFDKKLAYRGTTDRFETAKIYLLNPYMAGLLVGYDRSSDRYAHLWINWMNQKDIGVRERFRAGLVTSYARDGFFTTSAWSMQHVASEQRAEVLSGVVEDLQAEILVGYKWAPTPRVDLSFATGVYGSYERDRVAHESYRCAGLIAELKARYHRVGLEGYTYYGTGHQKLRAKYGELLYQENPFLQDRSYTQIQGFWQIWSNHGVDLRLDLGLHLIPKGLYSHQALTLNVAL